MTNKTRTIALSAIIAFAAIIFAIPSCKHEKAPQVFSISSLTDTLKVPGDGDTTTIAIKADASWVSDVRVTWISVEPAVGDGDETITVAVAPNIKNSNRTATLCFYIKGHPEIDVNIPVVQAPSGKEDPAPDPGEEEEPVEDNSSVVIPKGNFNDNTTWSLIGTIGGTNWKQDFEMFAEPDYGWIAAFDVTVSAADEFKFRKDADWDTNLGAGKGQPAVDVRYTLAETGGNLKLPAGTYDLYVHPTYSLLYVEEAGATFAHGDAVPAAEQTENVRIYILNNSDWNKPFLYAYVGAGELQPYGEWPGTYAVGTKKFGDYTWTYWEASGFNGVGNVNLVLNNEGSTQYPAKDEKEPLWSSMTIMNTLYFVWDGTTVTQVDDPAEPGVTGTGTEPAEMKFGSSNWTVVGEIDGTEWGFDFPMDTEGYWEVARDINLTSGCQFKFRKDRKWESSEGANDCTLGIADGQTPAVDKAFGLSVGSGNIVAPATGSFDLYLCAGREDKIAYIIPAGSSWTHEADGRPSFEVSGQYSSTIAAPDKRSGLTYQVNVFSFKDSNGDGWGDFNGLAQSLDYFDQLGVTALWLSPVQPAQSYHGYDVTDYETVNKRYGTEADFQNLIKEAHKHNIRIYMDYVMNHSGDQNKWFNDVKNKGTKSEYWDYYSLSKDPDADVRAGKIAQIPSYYGADTHKWFPVMIGGKEKKRYKVDLDWSNAAAPTMTVTETTDAVTTSGPHSNPARYLYWGGGTYSQFVDAGTDKYTLTIDYLSDWGCLVRTTNQDEWKNKTKWGFSKTGDQMKLGEPHVLYSDDDPDKVQSIIMPGGEVYYYYSEFGTGLFADFNYGPADDCQNSAAFKAIMRGVEKWLKMGVDGFRLDAVKHIYADENGQENKTFWNKFYTAANEIYKANTSARADLAGAGDEDIFMVGEVLSGEGECRPFYSGLPALFEFQFWWDLRNCLNSETIYSAGYDQNFPGSLKYRWEGHRGVRLKDNGYPQDAIATPKLANHDEDRTASSLGNYKPKIRLAAAVLLTSPGRPFIYQGEELGYWGTKAGGDEYVRTPILWTSSTSSAASKGVSNKVDWGMLKPSISVEYQSEDETSLLTLYRHFGYARNINAALANGWPEPDERTMGGYDGKVAGWYMHECVEGGKVALVLHNFSGYTQNVQRWPGDNATNETILVANGKVTVTNNPDGNIVTLPPYSSVVFALN